MAVTLKKTMLELVVLGALGLLVGFGANAVRGSGSIKINKNYFSMSTTVPMFVPVDGEDDAVASDHADHPFQTMTFAEVVALFDDPATRQGLNVFVDARNDMHYEDGHIPGAVQCDPFEVERYLDELMYATNGVEKIVVYCGGGDCKDSIFMCRELVELGLPLEAIYLFKGGWEEWLDADMPVALGREE